MRISFKAVALVTATATVTAAIGVAAGTVIGSDGSADIGDRLTGGFAAPETVHVQIPDGRAKAEASGKKKKPVVIHGSGSNRTVAANGNDSISLICPDKFPVPLSAGLSTEAPGVFPGIIERSVTGNGMFVAVVNITNSDIEWRPTAACAKGMKEG
jgi:hypothetical protein